MRRNPYLIDGPAVISFSGGRTSGLMLNRILDAGIQPDVHVLFANTGKERPETLTFVRECARRWGVVIHWLEYGRGEIDPDTASTGGEPFAAAITARNYLPNPITRFCTVELKIVVKSDWMAAHGYDQWENAIGLRADEPARVARMIGPGKDKRETVICPLAADRVTIDDVSAFWKLQPFDLQLLRGEGNCDLCFLKGQRLKLGLIRDRPESAQWWADQEARIIGGNAGLARFRYGRMSYAEMADAVARSPLLPFPPADDDPDDIGDCVCHE